MVGGARQRARLRTFSPTTTGRRAGLVQQAGAVRIERRYSCSQKACCIEGTSPELAVIAGLPELRGLLLVDEPRPWGARSGGVRLAHGLAGSRLISALRKASEVAANFLAAMVDR